VVASYLSNTIDKWFIKAHSQGPFPSFDAFITAFRTWFIRAENDGWLRIKIERIEQGVYSPLENAADF
jgi:hypothetical protein